jgi:hypothetical protein
MLDEHSWDEFRKTGLLWWINRTLHLFGWAIVVEMSDDGEHVGRAYPARCKFRGFAEESETQGFEKLTNYINDESKNLLADLEDTSPEDKAE